MATKEQYYVAVVNGGNTTLNISASSTTSSVLYCGGAACSSLLIPSGWTTCDITFNVGKAPGQLYPLHVSDSASASAVYSIAGVTASQWLKLLPIYFHDITHIQLVCSVAQASDVVVDTIMAPYYQGIHA